MGSNYEGKLGLGAKHITHISAPQILESLLGPSITEVSCGDNHTVAITSTGEVYSGDRGSMVS